MTPRSRRRAGLEAGCALLGVLAVLSFYAWTAWTSGGLPAGRGVLNDYYSELVHGLLKGHLYLDVPVDPAMVAAKNPYAYDVWRYHGWMVDASYYHGRYFLYFGVVPAVLFLLPYHLITGLDLWLGTADFYVASAAFVVLAALILRIRRRHFPDSSPAWIVPVLLALGFNVGILSLIRRPWIYELPIASGLLFVGGMLHALFASLESRRPACWLALAGVCLGLAVGSRPPFLLAGASCAWVAGWHRWRQGPRSWRPLLALAVGFGAVFALILAYNAGRFGNPLEFGLRYQLTDPPASQRQLLALRYVPFNLESYFFNGLRWSRYFPFVQTIEVGRRPPGYFLSEWIYGQLKYAPALVFALGVALLGRRRVPSGGADALPATPPDQSPPLAGGRRWALAGLLVGSWMGPLVFDLAVQSSAARYLCDFLPCLLLTAAVGFFAIDSEARGVARNRGGERVVSGAPGIRAGRRTLRIAAGCAWAAAVGVSAFVAAIYSIPLYGSIVEHRGASFFWSVARTCNTPTFWFERLADWRYGPVTLKVRFPGALPEEKLVSSPAGALVTESAGTGRVRLGLRFGPGGDVRWSRSLPVGAGAHVVSVSFGALYPPIEHPYYLKHPYDAADRAAAFVALDGTPVLEGFRLLPPVDCRDIRIASGGAGAPGDWFKGAVLDVERNRFRPPDDFQKNFEPASLEFRAPPARCFFTRPCPASGRVSASPRGERGPSRARPSPRSRARRRPLRSERRASPPIPPLPATCARCGSRSPAGPSGSGTSPRRRQARFGSASARRQFRAARLAFRAACAASRRHPPGRRSGPTSVCYCG